VPTAVPVLVVSGFLGSGKTTLVRRLLDAAQAAGERVAFVSNELGELGVDEALLGGGEERFVELAGGCVCCALNDELFETLVALKEAVDPDRVVIETSGVALPADVQIVLFGPGVAEWVSEEAVVTVVDSDRLHVGDEVDETFVEQVEAADLVVLHKVDLVPASAIPTLRAQVEEWNPGVPTVVATHGRVDPRVLLSAPVSGRVPPPHDHHAHAHLHEVYETERVLPPATDATSLASWAGDLGALRVKGFVRHEDQILVVQGVGRRVEVRPHEGAVPEELIGEVVVIRRRATIGAPHPGG